MDSELTTGFAKEPSYDIYLYLELFGLILRWKSTLTIGNRSDVSSLVGGKLTLVKGKKIQKENEGKTMGKPPISECIFIKHL